MSDIPGLREYFRRPYGERLADLRAGFPELNHIMNGPDRRAAMHAAYRAKTRRRNRSRR